jgi:hypothetical protein
VVPPTTVRVSEWFALSHYLEGCYEIPIIPLGLNWVLTHMNTFQNNGGALTSSEGFVRFFESPPLELALFLRSHPTAAGLGG